MKKYQRLINEMYYKIDRMVLFKDLKPINYGNYISLICPQCGKRRAFTMIPHMKTIKCNRINNCSYEKTFIQFYSNSDKPREEEFKKVLNDLCAMSGIEADIEGLNSKIVFEKRKTIDKKKKNSNYNHLKPLINKFQRNLKNSIGEMYLFKRGLSKEIIKRFKIGYAPFGQWPHLKDDKKVMQSKNGRIVIPIFENQNLINLYGRAVDFTDTEKNKHAFLPGSKGIFNPQGLYNDEVYIVEGAFDTFSVIMAGKENVTGLLHSLSYNIFKKYPVKTVIQATDQSLKKKYKVKFKEKIIELGINYKELDKKSYRRCDDLSETWEKYENIKFLYKGEF
ncbi:MAG: hypothetical protein GY714_09040 [Desulfobacterales bacterium]|nr:hypothetical protein [Desulfobacterales bacterium]